MEDESNVVNDEEEDEDVVLSPPTLAVEKQGTER